MMIEVPWESLDDELLNAVIEEFVSREGTDYGHAEVSLAQKVAQVRAQLRARRAMLVFDEESETTDIVHLPL